MATQKPISTISYNTEFFLREKLDEWVEAHIIQAYQYILHKGEDGDKDHIHLRIEPNKRVDQMDLTEALREWVQGSDKPLGVRPWRPSKEEDWVLYVVHNPDYLKLKYSAESEGSHEKLPYDWQDIQVSPGYDLEACWVRALASLKHLPSSIAQAYKGGLSELDLVFQGANPFTVSTVCKLVAGSDYADLNARYHALKRSVDKVLLAIDEAGFDLVFDKSGTFSLRAKETFSVVSDSELFVFDRNHSEALELI